MTLNRVMKNGVVPIENPKIPESTLESPKSKDYKKSPKNIELSV